MSVTPIGYILGALSLLIFVQWPSYLTAWAIIVSAFQAASVMNLGGAFPIGITPYFFVVTLIVLRFIPQWLSGRIGFANDDQALPMIRCLILLTAWGIISAFVLPHVFAGLDVDTPRQRMDPLYTEPLRWTMSNVAQAGYLLLNCLFLIYAVSSRNAQAELHRNINAFLITGLIVALFGAYQFIAHLFGLPFPTSFLNSNTAWEQLMDQTIAGGWRISATFNEPSSAGMFFSMWTAFTLFLATDRLHGNLWYSILLVIGLSMLVLTTSTTGYVAGGVLLILFVWKELSQVLLKGKISPRSFGILAIAAVAIALATMLLPHFHTILEDILFKKQDTISGRDRTATSIRAIYITAQTWGLGVGLGSNRPSGMVFYIMSNLGVAGLMLFGLMFYQTRLWVKRTGDGEVCHNYSHSIAVAAGWAFSFQLVAMAISGADISSPHIWIAWVLVLTACECNERDRRLLADAVEAEHEKRALRFSSGVGLPRRVTAVGR